MTGLVPFGFNEAAAKAQRYADRLKSDTEQSLDAAAEVFANDVRELAPRDSGEYRRSIKVVSAGPGFRIVASDKFVTAISTGKTYNLGDILEFGSRAHVIEGNPLMFVGGKLGPGVHFRMRVNHPGTPPFPHFSSAVVPFREKFPNFMTAQLRGNWS